jgi:hypothetical protein
MIDPLSQADNDREYAARMRTFFADSLGSWDDKLRSFSKYVSRQNLAQFLAKNELLEKALTVHGHIVECGVFMGGGLLTWAQVLRDLRALQYETNCQLRDLSRIS